jgi:acyl carrier protein
MQEDKFLLWFAEVLAVHGRGLTLTDSRDTVVEWDSLGSLLLLMRLEEDYRIVVEASEIEAVQSIGELYVLCRQRLPGS